MPRARPATRQRFKCQTLERLPQPLGTAPEVLDDHLGHLGRRYVCRNARPQVGIIDSWREPIERFNLAEADAKVERIVRCCISSIYLGVVVSEQTTGGQQIISSLQCLRRECRRPRRDAGHDENRKQHSPCKHHHVARNAVGTLYSRVIPEAMQHLKKIVYDAKVNQQAQRETRRVTIT